VDELLVSDDDRHAVVRQLQKHTADGRLTIDEFSDRVDEAYRARTASDLRAVLRNLPPTVVASPPVRRQPRRPHRSPLTLVVAIAFIMLGVWAVTGLAWFPFPLIFVCFIWSGRRRHAYR
jgi:hypothetical protein